MGHGGRDGHDGDGCGAFHEGKAVVHVHCGLGEGGGFWEVNGKRRKGK